MSRLVLVLDGETRLAVNAPAADVIGRELFAPFPEAANALVMVQEFIDAAGKASMTEDLQVLINTLHDEEESTMVLVEWEREVDALKF